MKRWAWTAVCCLWALCEPTYAESTSVGEEAGAGTPSRSGCALEFRVVNERSQEAIAGADLEIWLSGVTKKDVTDGQRRCRMKATC